MHHFFRLLWKWTVLLLASIVILLALGVGLFRLIVPQAPAYRAEVEQLAEKVIGFPVTIESLSLEWEWFGPELILHNVRLLGPQEQVVLVSANQVQVVINLTDIFQRPLKPARVTLVHPAAEMARDEKGNLVFSGIVLNSADNQHALRDWRNTLATLLTYTTTHIQNGEISWRTRDTLQAAGVPSRWLFSPVNLKLESDNNIYILQGDIGLPASLGKRLVVQATAAGPAEKPESWTWHGMLEGEKLQAQLIYWLLDIQDAELAGSLSILLKGEGVGLQPGFIHGNVHIEDLAQVSTRVPSRVASSAASGMSPGTTFQTIHSAFSWEVSPVDPLNSDSATPISSTWPAHWELKLQGLFVKRDNKAWPVSRWRITRTRLDKTTTRWQSDIGFVRLDDITALLKWLPPDVIPAHKKLVTLNPQGDVKNLRFSLQKKNNDIASYAAQAAFRNLGWSPLNAGFPCFGFQGLDGQLAFSHRGGRVQLTTQAMQAQFPGLFRDRLQLDFFNGTAYWQQQKTGWLLSAPLITLGNQDVEKIAVTLDAWLPTDKNQSPWIALNANYRGIDFAHKSRYLPVGIMPDNLVAWLDKAVISGQSPSGKLTVRGPLRRFPWPDGASKNAKGLFRVTGQLHDTVLKFDSRWPRLEAINGRVLFEGLGFHAWANNVVTSNITLQKAQAGMADMTNGLLTAQAKAVLPIDQGVAYLRATPLAEKFSSYFEHVALQGKASASVDLRLPLSHIKDSAVNVAATLQSTQAKVTGVPALFKNINAQLIITEQGLSSPGFSGQWLGQPFTGKIVNNDATRIYVSGQSSVDDLSRTFNWPLDDLSGGSTWQAELALTPDKKIPLQLHITTPLKGVAVNLPSPFGKTENSVKPLQVDLAVLGSQKARLDVYYADAAARLIGQLLNDTWQLDTGKLVLGSVGQIPGKSPGQTHGKSPGSQTLNALPANGLSVVGELPHVVLNEWLQVLEKSDKSAATAINDSRRFHPPRWLHSVDITVGSLDAFAQSIPNLQFNYRRQPDMAAIDLQSKPLAGTIKLPLQADLPLTIDMARLWLVLPPESAEKVPASQSTSQSTNQSTSPLEPTQIPALAISIKELRIEDANVGTATLSLKPVANGIALESLTIEGTQYNLQAHGEWVQARPDQRTTLDVQAHSTAVAETLRALGFAAGVTADSGRITGQLNWPGSPFGDILAVLNGQLHLRLEDGTLHEVEPGAGRLFGLLSLSALPRRLLLDFSDFFSKGLSFDTISGDFILVNGNAYTSNLALTSPAADILMVGRIGLGAQDFEQLAIVDVHVSSALPVVGALAAGPQAGAIMLLLTQLLDEPLEKASRRKYRITGSWENPLVEQVTDEQPKNEP